MGLREFQIDRRDFLSNGTMAGLSITHPFLFQVSKGRKKPNILLIMSDEHTNLGLFAFYLAIIGTGTGCTFQPTLVALQAQTPAIQRAVVTSNRNFIRCAGGAIGLAVCSTILSSETPTTYSGAVQE